MTVKIPCIFKLSQIIIPLSENATSLEDIHNFLVWGYVYNINPANL